MVLDKATYPEPYNIVNTLEHNESKSGSSNNNNNACE